MSTITSNRALACNSPSEFSYAGLMWWLDDNSDGWSQVEHPQKVVYKMLSAGRWRNRVVTTALGGISSGHSMTGNALELRYSVVTRLIYALGDSIMN